MSAENGHDLGIYQSPYDAPPEARTFEYRMSQNPGNLFNPELNDGRQNPRLPLYEMGQIMEDLPGDYDPSLPRDSQGNLPTVFPDTSVLQKGEEQKQGEETDKQKKQVIVISNRLPANLVMRDGRLVSKATYGGLVTAMTPLLNGSGYEGVWIGWPGTTETEGLEEALQIHADKTGLNLKPVKLDPIEQKIHYLKVSNEIIWPLFHATPENSYLQRKEDSILEKVNFKNQSLIPTYYKVIEDFIPPVSEQLKVSPDSKILVQDYQMLGFGRLARKAGITQDMGFFLHIPFPPLKILQDERLDQGMIRQFVLDLTYYNLTGFQTKKDLDNYKAAVRHYVPEAQINEENNTVEIDGRKVKLGDYLISMDTQGYEEASHTKRVLDIAKAIQADFQDKQVILAGGRLEYTKGFVQLLKALKLAFEKKPELLQKLRLVLYTPLSREEIPAYQALSAEVDQLVKEINDAYIEQFAERYPSTVDPETGIIKRGDVIKDTLGNAMYVEGGLPVIHLKYGLQGDIKYAMEKTVGIRPHPSIIDGAELMIQEDAVSATNNTVLMIGKDAGSANRVEGAVKINPLNIEEFADHLIDAAKIPPVLRRRRTRQARRSVKKHPIQRWGHKYMRELEEAAA